MTDVAVIGAGNIGGTLARKWSGAGHRIRFGAPDLKKPALRELAEEFGARATSIPGAIRNSDVVLFAIPGCGHGRDGGCAGGRSGWEGGDRCYEQRRWRGHAQRRGHRGGRARCLVRQSVQHLGWELLEDPMIGGIQADLFFCSPDGRPRAAAERLIADVELRPVSVGGPEEVDVVDGLLRVRSPWPSSGGWGGAWL